MSHILRLSSATRSLLTAASPLESRRIAAAAPSIALPALRTLHSTHTSCLPSPCSNNPGARIPKSHSGAKKRFSALGSSKGLPIFKRGKVGKRHLNTHMSGGRLNGLGGTTIERLGRTSRMIRRLLGPRL